MHASKSQYYLLSYFLQQIEVKINSVHLIKHTKEVANSIRHRSKDSSPAMRFVPRLDADNKCNFKNAVLAHDVIQFYSSYNIK